MAIDASLQARLDWALQLAEEAGQLTLDYFLSDRFQVSRKSDSSPVTQADLLAEKLLRDRIAERFAEDAIVGEELGVKEGTSGFCWILDPIDGTKSFICGVPLYSQLIGILRDEQSVVGVISVPGLRETVYAAQGGGAWWKRANHPVVPARVSANTNLAEGTFLLSQVDSFAKRGAGEAFLRLQNQAYITRTWGDGYGYLLVATGRADVMVDPIMNVWDAAAILPVMQEAGGAFTDWRGRPRINSGEGIGASRGVLDQVLQITRDYAS
jgi:histidinol phosphatase-like enzyme (inositol monophosphatase family)